MLLILFPLLFTVSFGLKTVTTNYGKIRGITDFTDGDNHKYMFKGVPFAKPPLGNLRFALPEKPDSWNGVLDASKYSAACLSNSSWTSTPQKLVSEDCLYINIFTSEKCLINKCPVIVYYHGGSFNLDSATMFPDKFILERYADNGIVFVIPAYRLGVFGQFYLGDPSVTPTNLLIHDSIHALHYVHEEIANFGGDPDDVTIMGHSSGGELVNSLGFSHLVDPDRKLFQKFIVLSSHEMFGFEQFKKNNSFEISKKFNCVSENVQEVLECMRKVDAHDLIQAQKYMEEEEGHLFKSILQAPPLMDYNEKLADFKKNTPARKLLCGVSEHEFEKYKYKNFHVNGRFLDFENPLEVITLYRENYANMSANMVNSDSSSVFVSAATYSEAMVNAGADVYLFETRQKPYSMHVSDMQFFIGIHRENVHTHDMDILDSFYSKLLVNFTKYGEPSPYWDKLDLSKMNFLALEIDSELGIVPKMEEGFHEDLVNFWLIDMMELDRNITKEKEQKGEREIMPTKVAEVTQHNEITQTTQATQTSEPKPTDHVPSITPILINDSFSNQSNEITTIFPVTEPITPESYPIYNQWWFYAIIIFIVFVASVVILIILNRKSNSEAQPLLP